MSSRALILATVMLLVGCLAAERALAQATNLEAGKTPAQIFAGTCNACHKAPRGLLKTVPASSLSSFLRQHYTTSPEMAGVLASYLISNGASDTRLSGAEKKGAKEGKEGQGSQAGGEAAGAARSLGPQDSSGRRAVAGSRPGFIGRVAAVAVAGDDRGRQRTECQAEAEQAQQARRGIAQGRGARARREGSLGAGRDRQARRRKAAEAPSQSANAAPSRRQRRLRCGPIRCRRSRRRPAAGSEPAPAEHACIRHIGGDQRRDRAGRSIALQAGRAAACGRGRNTGAAAGAAGRPARAADLAIVSEDKKARR